MFSSEATSLAKEEAPVEGAARGATSSSDEERTVKAKESPQSEVAEEANAEGENKLAVSEAENKALAAQLAAAEAESKAMELEIKALAAQLAATEARANSMDTLMAELLERGASGSAGVTPPAAALAETRRAEGLNAAANGSVCCRRTAGGH